MNQSYWRPMASEIIREVIATVGRDDPKALRKALRDAYPWGERRLHPYRIWCDEVNRQIYRRTQRPGSAPSVSPGQLRIGL